MVALIFMNDQLEATLVLVEWRRGTSGDEALLQGYHIVSLTSTRLGASSEEKRLKRGDLSSENDLSRGSLWQWCYWHQSSIFTLPPFSNRGKIEGAEKYHEDTSHSYFRILHSSYHSSF